LGRVTEHRISMLRNLSTSLLRHEHLVTTVPRAKELRPYVERLITIAKRGVVAGDAQGKTLNARRLVMKDIQDREVVSKLFDTLAPRFESRAGGYTRLLRLGYRKGDSAEIAQVELVGSEFNPKAQAEAEAAKVDAPKPKGVGGRLRAAAERLRGGKKDESGESPQKTKAPKPQRGVSRKTTTPRKAGGS
jgi:large subunit ribosomal protein L17